MTFFGVSWIDNNRIVSDIFNRAHGLESNVCHWGIYYSPGGVDRVQLEGAVRV